MHEIKHMLRLDSRTRGILIVRHMTSPDSPA
jgi:hypothetical protein